MTSTATLQFNQAVSDIMAALTPYVPAAAGAGPLPASSLSIVSLLERSIGIGRRRGADIREALAVADVFGGRVEAAVRFELWMATPADLNMATLQLQQRLRADADALRNAGFLRLRLAGTTGMELVPGVGGCRSQVEYAVLYEYQYRDPDGTESLIASIPIAIDSGLAQTTTVTDAMVRWDNESAPALELRGPARVGMVSALSFLPGPAPTGSVMLTRTFDDAGAPPALATLPALLTAVGGPTPAQRSGRVTFASVTDFLAAFAPGGPAVSLGDWNLDGVTDSYAALRLVLAPAIELPLATDRLELAHQNPALDQVGVVYLRATRGLGI